MTIPGWQTATNQSLNISVQYPPQWKIIPGGNGIILILAVNEHSNTSNPGITINSPVFHYKGSNPEHMMDEVTGKGVPQTAISIAGHQGWERKISTPASADIGGQYYGDYILFINGKGKLILVALDSYRKSNSDIDYYPPFSQIVSTIKELN